MTSSYHFVDRRHFLILVLALCYRLTPTAAVHRSKRANTAAAVIGESLRLFELRQCFEQKRLIGSFSSPNLLAAPQSPEHRKWCLRAFTDRNASHTKNLVDLSSWVEFSWYRLDHSERSVSIPCIHGSSSSSLNGGSTKVPRCRDARPSCTVAYDGFRGEYRLSPDFGGYPKCSPTLEQYFFKLHNRSESSHRIPIDSIPNSRQRYDAPSKRGCPLKRLPFSLDDFGTCTLASDAWYVLQFRSYARWENESGALIEAMGKEASRLVRTFEEKDEIYLTHTQVSGCLLKTIFLLRHKLPFLLRLKVDVHVKNEANAVRQVHQQDRHDVGVDLVGKEFTYQLPPGTRLVRYCQQAEAILDRDPDLVMSLPNEVHSCVARAVANCPADTSSAYSSSLVDVAAARRNLVVVVFIAISLLVRATIMHF